MVGYRKMALMQIVVQIIVQNTVQMLVQSSLQKRCSVRTFCSKTKRVLPMQRCNLSGWQSFVEGDLCRHSCSHPCRKVCRKMAAMHKRLQKSFAETGAVRRADRFAKTGCRMPCSSLCRYRRRNLCSRSCRNGIVTILEDNLINVL
jgi:hypothetical protein